MHKDMYYAVVYVFLTAVYHLHPTVFFQFHLEERWVWMC